MKKLNLVYFVLFFSLFNNYLSSMDHEIMLIIQNSPLEHIQEICFRNQGYCNFLLHHLDSCRECPSIDVLNWLIEIGIDINIQDECGETALHHAVRDQNRYLVEKLLFYGADDTICNHKDLTPLNIAQTFEMEALFWELQGAGSIRNLRRVAATNNFHPPKKTWLSKFIKHLKKIK